MDEEKIEGQEPIEEPIENDVQDDVDDVQHDEDDSDDELDEEPELYESEADYLKQKGIEDFDDISSFVEDYKNKVKRLNQLESLSDTVPEKPRKTEKSDDSENKFGREIFSNTFKNLAKIAKGDDNKQFYNLLGETLDESMVPFLDAVEKQQTMYNNAIMQMVNYLREDSWNRLPNEFKNLAKREDIDKIMNAYGFLDYRKGFNAHVLNNPKLLNEYAKINEQKGIEKGKKLKFQRSSSPRRDKSTTQQTSTDSSWKKYLNANGEFDFSGITDMDERLKILDSYAKSQRVKL